METTLSRAIWTRWFEFTLPVLTVYPAHTNLNPKHNMPDKMNQRLFMRMTREACAYD